MLTPPYRHLHMYVCVSTLFTLPARPCLLASAIPVNDPHDPYRENTYCLGGGRTISLFDGHAHQPRSAIRSSHEPRQHSNVAELLEVRNHSYDSDIKHPKAVSSSNLRRRDVRGRLSRTLSDSVACFLRGSNWYIAWKRTERRTWPRKNHSPKRRAPETQVLVLTTNTITFSFES